MADTKISALPAVTDVLATDEYVLARSSVSKKITAADLLAGATSGYGTSLPGSPGDGEEYTLVDSTTSPTYQWRFRYNASNSTSYKWEFVGGTFASAEISTLESTGSTSYTNLSTTGPSFVVPQAGVYMLSFGAQADNNGASGFAWMALKLGSAATADAEGAGNRLSDLVSISRTMQRTLAASDTVLAQYKQATGGQTARFQYRWITVQPVRVS